MNKKRLTILIPALNEELNLPTLRERLETVFAKLEERDRARIYTA